jgi:hypothetical protein
MSGEYFENGIEFPHTPSDVRKLIGKRIKYVRTTDTEPSRGCFFPRYGTVKDVHSKNVLIDGNWEWIPSFLEYEIIPEKLIEAQT